MQETESIVAPATPGGESALAVLRTSGPSTGRLAAACHGGVVPPPRLAWHGDFVDVEGRVLDDVVFTYFKGPHSYTGEDCLEISCHGNPLIVAAIIRDLTRRGFRLAEPGEFTKRAFLHGRIDLTEAEAVMDLIRARSDRALDVARRQLRGALRERMDMLTARLLDLCAAVEARIDFPEDDLPEADLLGWRSAAVALAGEMRALAGTRRAGDRLREGVKVVLAGPPNAGKSSLLNRLLGFERAIVSPEAGTTRDFLEERLRLDGRVIRLFDTAGLREADADVERAGVNRTLERLREADVILLIADATAPMPVLPVDAQALLNGGNVITVANKTDLGRRLWESLAPLEDHPVEVSAVTGAGIDEMVGRLSAVIQELQVERDQEDEIAVNARHEQCLLRAVACLERAECNLLVSSHLDLAAVDIRSAIEELGGIVGRIDHEAVLDRLFADFCIGK